MTKNNDGVTKTDVIEHECPNCGGLMHSPTADEYCIECYHEERI